MYAYQCMHIHIYISLIYICSIYILLLFYYYTYIFTYTGRLGLRDSDGEIHTPCVSICPLAINHGNGKLLMKMTSFSWESHQSHL